MSQDHTLTTITIPVPGVNGQITLELALGYSSTKNIHSTMFDEELYNMQLMLLCTHTSRMEQVVRKFLETRRLTNPNFRICGDSFGCQFMHTLLMYGSVNNIEILLGNGLRTDAWIHRSFSICDSPHYFSELRLLRNDPSLAKLLNAYKPTTALRQV